MAEAVLPDSSRTPGLRRNYLSGYELTFQSVGTVAPSASMSLLIPVIFAGSGSATWFTVAVAGVGVLFLSMQMAVFGRRMASPGALYAYVDAGLGAFCGVVAGGSVLLAYLLFIATIPPQIANLVTGLLHDRFGVSAALPFRLAIMIVAVLVPWWLARRDIKLSTRVSCAIEVATMLLLAYIVGRHFVTGGALPDRASLSLHGLTIGRFYHGLMLSFLLYGGFETAMELGAEARHPFTMIPRILLVVVVILAGFFVTISYGTVQAFADMHADLAADMSPMATLSHASGSDTAGAMIMLGVFCSLLASSVGCVNAAARVLYAFAHRGMFFRAVAVTHPVHATPHRSIAVVSLAGFGIAGGLTLMGVSPLDQLSYVGTISSISILVAYLFVAVAAPAYLRRQQRLSVANVLGAAIALGFLALPLIGSLYPVPDYPLNLIPYVYLAVMSAGIAWFVYVRKAHPERLGQFEGELLTR